MKTYELGELLLNEMDKNLNSMTKDEHAIHLRKIANLKAILKDKYSVSIVVVDSKELCLQLQEHNWLIGNNTNETKDELIGFKFKTHITLADISTFTFKA